MDLHAVNGSVPSEQLEQLAEEVRRDPPHPGSILREECLGDRISVPAAARSLGLQPADLESVLSCRAPVSPDLALALEEIGWSSADVWVALQARHDLAQATETRTVELDGGWRFRDGDARAPAEESQKSSPGTLSETCTDVSI